MELAEFLRLVKQSENGAQRTEPASLVMQSRNEQKFSHRASDAIRICEPQVFKVLLSKLVFPKIHLTQFLLVLLTTT